MTGTLAPSTGSVFGRVTGRGFAVNLVYDIVLQLVVLVQMVLVPRLLGPTAMGIYALAMASVGTATSLKEFGIGQKLVQDEEGDSEITYRVALTLELVLAAALFLLAVATAPILAVVYHRPLLVPITAVAALTLFTTAFVDLPSAMYLRRLQFGRYNLVALWSTLVGFVVTVALAAMGAGVWSLAAGSGASLVATAGVLVRITGAPPGLGWDRRIVKRFVRYGWPLWVGGLLGIASTWAGTITLSSVLGIAALGYFSMAQSLALRAFRLDGVLAQTLFPALCRLNVDKDVERRAFVATNRITVMWAGPLGFGVAVLAPVLVPLVLGPSWRPAVFLFQMQGLAVTVGSVGYSWDVFFRSRGLTRPTLTSKLLSEAWVIAVLLPAVLIDGLHGAGYAIVLMGPLSLVVRQHFLSRIFPGINLLANAGRELAATGAAGALTWMILRYAWHATTPLDAAGASIMFLGLSALFIGVVDRRFLLDLFRRLLATRRAAPVI